MTYTEKEISYADYVRLRESVNWNNSFKEQTEKCLKNTLYSIEVIDDDTSPAKESLKRVTEKIIEENSDFYFIVFHGEKVGGVRVRWYQGKKVYENVNWISPIFITPKF